MRTVFLLVAWAAVSEFAGATPLEPAPTGELIRPVSIENLKRELEKELPSGSSREKALSWLRRRDIDVAVSRNGPNETTLMGVVPPGITFAPEQSVVVVTLLFNAEDKLYLSEVNRVQQSRPRPFLKLPLDWSSPKEPRPRPAGQ